ncbi:piggyBac transposable element-derived protein 4-like [Microplitis mediator]|uniref:piggyBac transposable element-derived protein 4-like n=1 Tax=Microplitis mediator TaxID=375433 RepID=UPI0025552EDD|nr:piggyBac transposable element-derived protein 4-like [Microplitis mediator]
MISNEIIIKRKLFIDDNEYKSTVDEWCDDIEKTEVRRFSAFVGPLHTIPEGSTEEEYLKLFFDNDFYEMMAKQTNLYAQEVHDAGRPNKRWKPITSNEMKAFVGILIYMGIVRLPQLKMYFQSDFVQCPLVSNAMTRDRFKLISQYLHFNDNSKMPKLGSKDYDRLYKIRPVLEVIDKFKYVYRPDRDISVDEAMVAYKGNFSAKQYMKDKPTPWGLKFWVIAEASTGYTLDAKPYLGKKEETNKDLLLGEQKLEDNQIYGCGTIRQNRKEWPVQFKNPKNLKLKRGDFLQKQIGNITATVWQDNQPVTVLSTNCNPTDIVMLKNTQEKTNITLTFLAPHL